MYSLHFTSFLPFLSLIKFMLHHSQSLFVLLSSPSPFPSSSVVEQVPVQVISSRKHHANNFMPTAKGDLVEFQ